ncbi:WYL domain-containing protein [Vibrio alginolyticus]|uniref:WYL domain-containing protein n=1 Tax=Vibrio alginolyticus TaxID=663 RepID=UPI00124F4FFD|nr:WYL domain-containing protein [Vibrio alginolyticus]KAB2112171.1 WYL domain-containing protein [Vibrio alginolyticus]
MEILLFVIFGAFVYFKYSKSKMKKALEENPDYFFQYCREKGYNTSKEQLDLCKRFGLDSSVIFSEASTPSTQAKTPVKPQQNDAKFGDFDENLVVIWAGETKHIEFTYEKAYGKKERRTISPKEVCFNEDGFFYIKGICHLRNEPRTFKQDRITTMIKVGSQRYDFPDWCDKFLGVDVWSACPNAMIAAN